MIIYGRKYSKLDQALNELSLFQTNNVTKQTVSDLHFSQPGFKEMLDVIQKRRVIQSKESDITFIFILETGTGIQLGGLWANPSLVLGLLENKKPEFVSVLYENDLQAWIEDEKRGDLQTFSFFILVFAVVSDLISDIPSNDFESMKEKLKRSYNSIQTSILSVVNDLKRKRNGRSGKK